MAAPNVQPSAIKGANLELNKGDQFIICLDTSGSMGSTDTQSGATRYDDTLETLKTFVKEAEKWDPDGVSFYLFGAKVQEFRDTKSGEIATKIGTFKPESQTRTDQVIKAAYKEHKEKNNEQTFCMIFTDGAPSDPAALKQAIVDITKDVKDEKEFRIAFLTVGQRDADLNNFLTDLDDNLVSKDGAKYDIVDVKKIEEVDFLAAVEGALND